MTTTLEPQPGQPCPVCGLPDPEHDWDVHDASPPPQPQTRGVGAALPNMLLRSSTRGSHRVRVLCLHTTEGILKAADLRAWAGWAGSSHASADAGGVLMGPAQGFVPYHLAAWTLRSGNPWSENIELCGFAKWTRQQWLDRPRLLEAAAHWLAERSVARGIPLVKITAAQYRAGASGVIDHDDHTDGYKDGTHWDVGEQFPWDVVIPRARDIVNEGQDDMFTDEDRAMLREVRAQLTGSAKPGEYPGLPDLTGDDGKPRTLVQALGEMQRNLRRATHELVQLLPVSPARPAHPSLPDTVLGHVLSARAELQSLLARLPKP